MHKIQQYSSSESDENDDPQNKHSARLPPSKELLRVPTTSDAPDSESDPFKHQGRVRSFAHERGIWASYVFIDYNEIDAFDDLQNQLIEKSMKDLDLELNRVDNLHLSLTKTFVLRHHNIAAFVENMRSAISGTKRFRISLSDLAVYTNEENTRTFLAVKVADQSCGPLSSLVEKLDTSMREYKLPTFYKDPSFHISLLWCLGNRRQLLDDNMPTLQETFSALYEEEYCDMNINVKMLNFKCGNKYYSFDLL
ncbi:U6 snRNA phosphodiesterase [Aedes aegypti]|uniref:U6 snRNA phosphodiesterase n=1 Tax=Aedes aegypti TaxID=7159 RepID=A0A1S4FL98_AEDAE|nr:U6 snRNA phosphodiesterase [Aedes aegypti]